jgi:hypothetical protein
MWYIKNLLTPFLFSSLAAFVLFLSVYKPLHNWDMIAYIASAKSFEESNIKSLHSFTYDQLRHSVSEAEYQNLVRGNYQHAISTDVSAFQEQLPFYQIRPVYNGAIYLLYKMGIRIGFATHLISGIATALAIVLLYLMAISFLAKPFACALPLFVILFRVPELARFSTPDGLAGFALILSAYLYLKKRMTPLFLFLPITIGIRTDLILFAAPLLFLIFAFEEDMRFNAIASMFMCLAVYAGIMTFWKNPGWSTVFYFTLIKLRTHPISMPPTLTAHDYFHVFHAQISQLDGNMRFILYILTTAASLYFITNQAKATSVAAALKSPLVVLTIVCFVFILIHFLAFPVAWDRFFAMPYLIGVFSMFALMTERKVPNFSKQDTAACNPR